MPSTDVEIFRGRITEEQFSSGRLSYINAILIQSRGVLAIKPCKKCEDTPNRGPFTECRTMRDQWGGCCGNCKWRDWQARCEGVVRGINPQSTTEGSMVSEVDE